MFHLLTFASLKSLEGPYINQTNPNFGSAPPAPGYTQHYVAPPGPPPVDYPIPTAHVRTHTPPWSVSSSHSRSVCMVPDRVMFRVYQTGALPLLLELWQTLWTHSPGMFPTLTLLEHQPWMTSNVLLLAICVTQTRRLTPFTSG